MARKGPQLPDDIPEDAGCDLHPACLTCPFPFCIKEAPWGEQRYKNGIRAREMLKMKEKGMTCVEIAKAFDVHKRTAERWVSIARKGKEFDMASTCKEKDGD